MFDTYRRNVRPGPTNMSARINVEEKRAATDESIRLLNEMQEQARLNLIKQYTITDNNINGNVYYFKKHFTGEFVVDVFFTLNGKEYHSSESIRDTSIIESREQATTRLVECMAQAILNALNSSIEEVK